MKLGDRGYRLRETDTIYANRDDRFIVSLIVGYTTEDLTGEDGAGEPSHRDAARWALDLTRDDGANGTHWFVFDRLTGTMHVLEQDEFDPEMESWGG